MHRYTHRYNPVLLRNAVQWSHNVVLLEVSIKVLSLHASKHYKKYDKYESNG